MGQQLIVKFESSWAVAESGARVWAWARASLESGRAELSQDSRGLEGLYLVLILECRYRVYRSEALLMNVWNVNSFCWMLDVWMSGCTIASLYVNFIQVCLWR